MFTREGRRLLIHRRLGKLDVVGSEPLSPVNTTHKAIRKLLISDRTPYFVISVSLDSRDSIVYWARKPPSVGANIDYILLNLENL